MATKVKSLWIEFGIKTDGVNRGFKKLEDTTEKSTKKLKGFGSLLTKIFIGGGIALGIKKVTGLAIEQEDAITQLNATLKSTEGAVGLTSQQLQDMATSLQNVTRFGDEAIIGAESLLLTFKNVGEKVFPRATEAILDVSTAMKQDLRTSTIQIGKVLNDPIANMGALSRSGIQFTAVQKNMIKELQSTGRLMEAQEIILKELESQFGGSARAAADNFGGALIQAQNQMGDFFEEVGKGITKNESFKDGLVQVKNAFSSKEFAAGISSIISLFASLVGKIVEATAGLVEFLAQEKRLEEQAESQAQTFEESFDKIWKGLRQAGVEAETLNKALAQTTGGKEIEELTKRQNELNEIIKKSNATLKENGKWGFASGRATIALKKATKELNEVEAEKNLLLSLGIQRIVQTADRYGITKKQVDKLKKSLRGEVEEKIKVVKATKETTKATKEYNTIIPDTIELTDDWTEHAKAFADAAEDNKTILEGWNPEIEKINKHLGSSGKSIGYVGDETGEAEEELTGFAKILKKISDMKASEFLGSIATAFDFIGSSIGETDESFQDFTGMIGNFASGNYLGAISNAISLFSAKDGLTGQIEYATEALRELGITAQESIDLLADSIEEMWASMSMGEMLDMTADEWEKFLDDMQAKTQEVAEGSAEWFARIGDEVGNLTDFLSNGARGQMEFNDQVNITLGTFANLLKSGESITSALSMMGDAFDQLLETQKEGKFAGSDLFNELSKFRTLIKDNEALVKSVEGFNSLLQATASLGAISQEQMSSFARETQREFDKLIEAGFSENQALQMLGPALKTLQENSEKYGTTIDANTQKLIDQADQSGVFDEMADPLDTIAQILEKIFLQLGGSADALNAMGANAKTATGDLATAGETIGAQFSAIGEGAAMAANNLGTNLGEAASQGLADSLKRSGLMNWDLSADPPDLGTLRIDQGSLDAMAGLSGGPAGGKESPINVIEGEQKIEVNIKPQTVNYEELERAIRNNADRLTTTLRQELQL